MIPTVKLGNIIVYSYQVVEIREKLFKEARFKSLCDL